MGTTSSSLVEGMSHVWIQKPSGFYMFGPTLHFNHPKPAELIMVDANLWNSFSSELDAHVRNINAFLRSLWITYLTIFAIYFFTRLFPISFSGDPESMQWTDYGGLLIFPFILITMGGHFFIIRKNQKTDEEIKNTCESFDSRFKLKGFSIEYRTQHTGICVFSKHNHPMRVLVFVPEACLQDGQQDTQKDDDLIDREAWGLEL